MLASAPHNPFLSSHYLAARSALGGRGWILALIEGGKVVSGCTALELQGSARRRALEIPSVPDAIEDHEFWDGLQRFCRERRLWRLVIHSYGSPEVAIPRHAHELWRRWRREFVWDLHSTGSDTGLSSNHRRNIRRAGKAGLELHASEDPGDCEMHGRLVAASLDRRRQRGERVPESRRNELWRRFLSEKAGRLYQIRLQGEVVSSLLVLLAPRGAYYQSAGTSPDGMSLGASHYLVHGAAADLRQRGVRLFNLGGAGFDEEGLGRFKAGFGARAVNLEAGAFWMGQPWMLGIGRGLGLLRRLRPSVAADRSGG